MDVKKIIPERTELKTVKAWQIDFDKNILKVFYVNGTVSQIGFHEIRDKLTQTQIAAIKHAVRETIKIAENCSDEDLVGGL